MCYDSSADPVLQSFSEYEAGCEEEAYSYEELILENEVTF
jgi:hypothetical protein